MGGSGAPGVVKATVGGRTFRVPDVGDEITIAWRGRIYWGYKVSRIFGRQIEVHVAESTGCTTTVFVVDYEITWLHGSHKLGTPAADALSAASLLNL